MRPVLRFGFVLVAVVVAVAPSGCSQEKKEEAKPPQETAQQEATKAPVAKATGTGMISGVVKFAGTPPPPKKISLTKDTDKCGQAQLSEELIVGSNKGIQNAVVSLGGITGHPEKPASNLELDQRGCQFRPHVLIAPAGATIDILNSDGILHNFHTHSTKNPAINMAQPGFMKKMNAKFDQPEIVKATCDAHAWMQGWIVVAEHPYYAVTGSDGSFKLTNVPAGSYKLRVWHETLGEVTKEVTTKPGEETKVSFELKR